MSVNFAIPLVDIDNKAVIEHGTGITLAGLVIAALLTPIPAEENMSTEDKLKRFALAFRISKEPDNINLAPEEAQFIVSLAAKTYLSPLIVGRINDEITKV